MLRNPDRLAKATLSLCLGGAVLKQQQLPFQPIQLRVVPWASATFEIPQALADRMQPVVGAFGHQVDLGKETAEQVSWDSRLRLEGQPPTYLIKALLNRSKMHQRPALLNH